MNRSSVIFAVMTVAALGAVGCSRSSSSSAAPATPAPTTAQATTGGEAQQEAFGRMTVDELARAIDAREPITVVDNNGRERYEQGHIPGARHVGHDQVTTEVLPADRNARLVFYCYNEQCHACHTAANQALGLGYRNVFILPAGITGWAAANKPVVTGANPT